jgi:outer membrane immunogenic protein
MKRALLSGFGLCAFALAGTMAHAADMAVGPGPIVAGPYWTGFYIGGSVGGISGTFDPTTSTVFNGVYFQSANDVAAVNATGAQKITTSNVTIAGDVGYNWQWGNLVAGVEADIASIRLSGSTAPPAVPFPGAFTGASFNIADSASANWLFTARPRVGYAVNNWLIYATGGVAITNLNAVFAYNDNAFAASEGLTISKLTAGYTVGGGIEVGLWDRWTLRAEGLYLNFGTVSQASNNLAAFVAGPPGFPGQPFQHSVDLKASIGRVGLNYRF